MFQKMRVWMAVMCVAVLAGCGGGSSSGGGGGADAESTTPWVGSWRLVSESGGATSGSLTLNPASFTQTIVFAGGSGTCSWTGSVSGATATNLTITVDTGDGSPQCTAATGRSASPTWMVSDDGNELTLDYRSAIEFGTLQIWERT